MIWPGPRELVFSLKAYAAAMLGFWINCALDLPRPSWALFLVYVLMQPISGAVRSEAAYRMIGSLAGAAIMLVLFGLLANFPGALFLAIGAAAFACFFVALIDRMPSGHGIFMAGITIAVIGLPDTLDPLASFGTAITRIEEVLLAILCATLVDSVFFPHAAGVALNASVAGWLASAWGVTRRALGAAPPSGESADGLAKLATDAAALDALSAHVAYDSVPVRPAPRVVRLLHTRMLQLIRLIYSVQDWQADLQKGAPGTASVRLAFAAVADWVAEMPAPSAARGAAARAAIDALRATPDQAADALATLRGAMGELLRDLMAAFEDCLALQRAVAEDAKLPPALERAARGGRLSIPYRDPFRALLLLLPVVVAFLLVAAYYAATGWAQGPEAALMTLAAGLYASSAEEPGDRMVTVVVVMMAAGALAIVYQFALLPAIDDFPLLALALGLFLVPAGAFIPITAGTAMMLCVLTTALMGLAPEYDAGFVAVADIVLGALAGVGITAIVARVTMIPGIDWTTRHLRRVGWADLAAVAAGTWLPDPASFAMRALDRYAVLAPHLDTPGGDPDLTTAALLGELRIGLNVLRLRARLDAVPSAARPPIEAMLAALAAHFDARSRRRAGHAGRGRADRLADAGGRAALTDRHHRLARHEGGSACGVSSICSASTCRRCCRRACSPGR